MKKYIQYMEIYEGIVQLFGAYRTFKITKVIILF